MKKTTQKIILFFTFCMVIFAVKAQTIYYEDFRYENESRGFTVQKVALGGQLEGELGKRVNDIVDAADSSPVFDENSRPAERTPQGTVRDQKTIAFNNTSGSPADTNHQIEAWALMTNQDLSNVNTPKVSFWTQQRYVVGGGASLTVWVSQNYTHGMAPNTATWINETGNIIGNIATSDVSDQVYVKGALDLSAYTSTSVTVAFKVITDATPYSAGISQHGTFYISDVKFEATPQDVANGDFSALNTSASGQTNIFNTPSASISDANFTNTSKWADVLAPGTSVPRLAKSLMPAEEGYKFEVSNVYNPIVVSEVRYILVNGTSNQGTSGEESKWKVQGSNDDSTWDNLSDPVGMFSTNSGAGTAYPIALTTTQAYRYYRFVLASPWTPIGAYTALQQIDFTVDDSVLSTQNNSVLSHGISVYPNPTSTVINITTANTNIKIKNVKLIDITGKVIYNKMDAQPIAVQNYAKGLYLLRIESHDGAVSTKKVLVN
ncbi:T9SS type A sorting domain-containing protein [Mariniflexile ostreae]|uniref:T9SS type A sorting domain-containing protein n=1 Tax=Mariniflexile ostreae TaxID=1520892 RepID=A0ABV5FFK8_9FLAO